MCGIAGFAGLSDRALLESMTRALAHRGPDGEGFFLGREAGLGSRRLAVIDPEGGAQPVFNERGDALVFNGEIYNFRSLRARLEASGHRLRSRSDTEAIVHLYEEKGLDALGELSGMFALALWDEGAERLLLARDFPGVKPLYYAAAGTRLYFASEIKALLRVPELRRDVDLGALAHYLDYLYIPAPRTPFASVRKLRPGEWLSWSRGRVETGFFPRPVPAPQPAGRKEALEELDRRLARVVEEQLVSDVPVGLWLSGGLDSSALAYYLSRSGARLCAFCAHYEDGAGFNELDKARLAARAFGLPLEELAVRPDVDEALDALAEAMDDPVADASALPSLWISRLCRGRVKVALTGVGGDELFGGYPRYLGLRWLEPYLALPVPLRAALAAASRGLPDAVSSRNAAGWVRRFLGSDGDAASAYAAWMGHLGPGELASLCAPALAAAAPPPAPLEPFRAASGDAVRRALATDLATYLPDDLLALADRASMAAGLELRVPFCDPSLLELASAWPSGYRASGSRLKVLFKELLAGKLPAELLAQKKQGFMVPLGRWLRGPLRPLVERELGALIGRGLLRPEGAARLWLGHLRGGRNRADVLWALLLLERWFRRWLPDFRLEGGGA